MKWIEASASGADDVAVAGRYRYRRECGFRRGLISREAGRLPHPLALFSLAVGR